MTDVIPAATDAIDSIDDLNYLLDTESYLLSRQDVFKKLCEESPSDAEQAAAANEMITSWISSWVRDDSIFIKPDSRIRAIIDKYAPDAMSEKAVRDLRYLFANFPQPSTDNPNL